MRFQEKFLLSIAIFYIICALIMTIFFFSEMLDATNLINWYVSIGLMLFSGYLTMIISKPTYKFWIELKDEDKVSPSPTWECECGIINDLRENTMQCSCGKFYGEIQ